MNHLSDSSRLTEENMGSQRREVSPKVTQQQEWTTNLPILFLYSRRVPRAFLRLTFSISQMGVLRLQERSTQCVPGFTNWSPRQTPKPLVSHTLIIHGIRGHSSYQPVIGQPCCFYLQLTFPLCPPIFPEGKAEDPKQVQ